MGKRTFRTKKGSSKFLSRRRLRFRSKKKGNRKISTSFKKKVIRILHSNEQLKFLTATAALPGSYNPTIMAGVSSGFGSLQQAIIPLSGRGSVYGGVGVNAASGGVVGMPYTSALTESSVLSAGVGYAPWQILVCGSNNNQQYPVKGVEEYNRIGDTILLKQNTFRVEMEYSPGYQYYTTNGLAPPNTIYYQSVTTNDMSMDLPDYICMFKFTPVAELNSGASMNIAVNNFTASVDLQTAYYGGYIPFEQRYGIHCAIKRFKFPQMQCATALAQGDINDPTVDPVNSEIQSVMNSTAKKLHIITIGKKFKGRGKKLTFPRAGTVPNEFLYSYAFVNYMASTVTFKVNQLTRFYDEE